MKWSSIEEIHKLVKSPLNQYSRATIVRVAAEKRWTENRRPFFNLWPCISDALCRTSLDLSPRQIFGDVPTTLSWSKEQKIPFVCVRTSLHSPITFPPDQYGKYQVLSALVGAYPTSDGFLMFYSADFGPRDSKGVVWSAYWNMFDWDSSIQEQLDKQDIEHDWYQTEGPSFSIMLRICISLFIIAQNPHIDLVTPVVLNADKAKYDLNGDQKYVDKARRRGVIGWDIGANIEFSPHFRRPHFGLRWTGKGKQVPQIVPIKGCIVKRNKMMEVPTGYLDDLSQRDGAGLV